MLANPQSSFLNPSFIFVLIFGEVIGLKLLILIYYNPRPVWDVFVFQI